MARTVRDAKLESRSARLSLSARIEPHWKSIDSGLALGYRRNKKGGTWLARRWDGEKARYREHKIGPTDDVQDPDGLSIFSFSQAQSAARNWWQREERVAAGLEEEVRGPYCVADALSDYFLARERKGSRGVYSDRRYADSRINPILGATDIAKLTAARIRRWHEDLAVNEKMLRTKSGARKPRLKAIDRGDPDAVRARQASANRVLTILKAALNCAFQNGRIHSDTAWRQVKAFRAVDAAVVRYLSASEAVRLVDACPQAFRKLVQAALLTGCRYSELVRLAVPDFNSDNGTISVRISKSGTARHVYLTEEGQRLFSGFTEGKNREDLIFRRADDERWGPSHQQRPLIEASKKANIQPPATFHILRHTYASMAAMNGIPIEIIAEQLGHSDTRITQKHYAHLSPNYVATSFRQRFGTIGLIRETRRVPTNRSGLLIDANPEQPK